MSESSATTESFVGTEQRSAGRRAPGADQRPAPSVRSPVESPAGDAANPGRKAQAGDRGESHLWLRRSDQLFVGVLATAAVVLLAGHWAYLSGWGMRPVEIEHLPPRQFDYRLDVNAASEVQWLQLEGIGDTLAERIVRDREQNGPFSSIGDLQRVKGIGPKTVERLRPWLYVRQDDPPSGRATLSR